MLWWDVFKMSESIMFKGQFLFPRKCHVSVCPESKCVCVWLVWFGKSRPQTRSSSRHVPPWLTKNDSLGKPDTYFMCSIKNFYTIFECSDERFVRDQIKRCDMR